MNWIANYKKETGMKKIGIVLLWMLSCWACSDDDNGPNIDITGVSAAESFTDVRDGQVYKCIRVGNQVWMAENLNFHLPKGVLDGSFTWEEPLFETRSVDISEEDFQEKTLQAIRTGEIKTVIIHYPFGDLESGPAVNIKDYLERGLSAAAIMNEIRGMIDMMKNYPDYYTEEMVSAYKSAAVVLQRIFDELLGEVIVDFARTHFEKYEAENSGYSSAFGRLYSYEGAMAAVPEGWRLPSDEDWKELEKCLGMSSQEADKFDCWRGDGIGTLLKAREGGIGFNALYAGCNAYTPANDELFIRKDEGAYFWTSTLLTETDSTHIGIVRSIALFDGGIMRATTKLKGYKPVLYSVRCIRKNEE